MIAHRIKRERQGDDKHGWRARLHGLDRLICMLVCVGALSACSSFQPPQPWEKGLLARPDMAMDGDALESRFTQHVLDSKEGSAGGYGVGGGGCGCN